MSSLIEEINNTREETISFYYGAALAELKDKIRSEPFQTEFYIYSGCVSKEITKEIASRFNKEGLKVTICKRGIFITQYYLKIEISLSGNTLEESVCSKEQCNDKSKNSEDSSTQDTENSESAENKDE